MKKRKASKRQYGEGSIYQSHGRWYFIHLGNGKRDALTLIENLLNETLDISEQG